MIKLIKILGFFLFAVVLSACNEYNKVVKSDDYAKKFQLANQLFEEGQIAKVKKRSKQKEKKPKYKEGLIFKSITLYEQVYQRMPKTGEGELAYFRIGQAYYFVKDYNMAGYYFGAFSQRFPFSVKTQDALFQTAMCSVNNSPEASLDQNDTEVAINNLQQFINTYPNSILVDSCNKIMDKLRLKIENKEYQSVKLYARTSNYRAACTAAQTFVDDYPRSKMKEEVFYLLVNNSYLLAINSVENKKCERIEQTIERYRTFVNEFPNSAYKVEVNRISDKMHKDFELSCKRKIN
jgi:outer membrane protein assembly factor BamD